MRKLFVAIIVSLVITAGAWAQDVQNPTTQKPKTVEELQWQVQALQNEFLYLQERSKTVQSEFSRVQAELKAMKATQPPKPQEKSKEEAKAEPKSKK